MAEYNGACCPNCGSEAINGGEFNPEGCSAAFRNIDCEDCGATWIECLKVCGYDNLKVPA
jgi:hypothetical protein